MKNILLVNPHTPDFVIDADSSIPLSLLYLGAALEKDGHEVKIVDMNNFQKIEKGREFSPEFFWEKTGGFRPDFVGISCLFSGRFETALQTARIIREKYPDVPIVLGGIHPTTFPKEIMDDYGFIDYIIIGEGEESFPGLIKAHDKGAEALEKVDGLAYRAGGKVIVNRKTRFIEDLDSLPFPAYNLIRLEDYYFSTSKWFNPKGLPINVPVPIITSRGCPNSCTFCSMYLLHGKKYRARSAKNVVDEIEFLYRKYGQRYFSFMDDNLTLIKGRILKIANGIIERGLDIQFDTPNGISLKTTDREIVDALVKAGLVRTCVAIESGSEFIRNQVIKKGLPTEKIYEFFRASERHRNLFVKAFFVIGYPQETRDTLNETLEMIKRIPIREVATFFVVPYPATELFNYCLEKHLLDLPMNNLHNLRTFSAVKGNNQVFIKPFSLEKDELVRFKAKAFAIVAEKNRNWYKEHPETTCSQEE